MTPLQKLNYSYATRRWAVNGVLHMAAMVLDNWAYPAAAWIVRDCHDKIKATLRAQYEHDKRVLLSKLASKSSA